MSRLSALRTRLRLLFAPGAADARMDQEFEFHLDMETDRLLREEGLSADEARRRARAAFGGVTQHTEELRKGRGLAWLDGTTLDFKLGLRMLVRYSGLTVIGTIAIATTDA